MALGISLFALLNFLTIFWTGELEICGDLPSVTVVFGIPKAFPTLIVFFGRPVGELITWISLMLNPFFVAPTSLLPIFFFDCAMGELVTWISLILNFSLLPRWLLFLLFFLRCPFGGDLLVPWRLFFLNGVPPVPSLAPPRLFLRFDIFLRGESPDLSMWLPLLLLVFLELITGDDLL